MPIGLTTAITAAAVVGAGATVYASSQASKASQNATNASITEQDKALAATQANNAAAEQTAEQTQGTALAATAQQEQQAQANADTAFAATNANAQPDIAAGNNAVGQLEDPTDNFTTSPGYAFRLSQGLNAVNTDKAVNGLIRSGGALKAVNNYAQGQASNEFANWWGQQQGLVNSGLSAQSLAAGANSGTANAAFSAANMNSNTAEDAAKAVTNASVGAATQDSNVAETAATNTGNLLTTNAANQGNADIATANSLGTGAGSLADLIAKYGANTTTGSSYSPSVPWGDEVGAGYTGTVAA